MLLWVSPRPRPWPSRTLPGWRKVTPTPLRTHTLWRSYNLPDKRDTLIQRQHLVHTNTYSTSYLLDTQHELQAETEPPRGAHACTAQQSRRRQPLLPVCRGLRHQTMKMKSGRSAKHGRMVVVLLACQPGHTVTSHATRSMLSRCPCWRRGWADISQIRVRVQSVRGPAHLQRTVTVWVPALSRHARTARTQTSRRLCCKMGGEHGYDSHDQQGVSPACVRVQSRRSNARCQSQPSRRYMQAVVTQQHDVKGTSVRGLTLH